MTKAIQKRNKRGGFSAAGGYLFVGPVAILLLLLIVYPLCYGLYISVFNTNLVNKWNFVGAKYYIDAITSPEFHKTILTTLRFMVSVVIGHFVVGFFLSNMLNKEFKGRIIFRIIFMLPWLFPDAVIALLFSWLFNPIYGGVNAVLQWLGIINENVAWFSSAGLAFNTTVFVNIWKGYPMVMTMILAGTQSIPADYYEAATIDGATKWEQFLYVTLPSLKSVIATTLILDSALYFKHYTLTAVMTNGGPGTATTLASIDIYKAAFENFTFGKASAMAVIVFVISYALSKLYRVVLSDD